MARQRQNRRMISFASTKAAARLTLGLLALAACAASGDRFKYVANFERDHVTLSVRIEWRADGDKRGLLRMDGGGLGGIMIFRAAEWTAVVARAAEAMTAAGAGQAQKFAEIEDTGGGRLRIEAASRDGKPILRFTRLDNPGGKYPDVVIELPAADFPELKRALEEVAKELARK